MCATDTMITMISVAEAKATMQAYLDDHGREKKGNQPRSLQDFYLIEEDVVFVEYGEVFLGG